jgi:DUF917 family protein
MFKIENTEDLRCFIDGCTLLGVGGGGNPEEGYAALEGILKEIGPIEWQDVADLDDDSIAICTFLMGSTAPLTEEKKNKMVELGLTEKKYPLNLANAVKEWEDYTGKKIDVIVPLEVGGSNMPVPMAVAKRLGKTIVDGDYAGRAVPEIFQISLMLEEVNFCPAASVDKYGNTCIIKESISNTLAERIGKYLSEVAFGSTGLAGFPITGKQLKRVLVRGSMSKAIKIGKALSRVRQGLSNFEDELAQFEAKVVFEGKVVKKDWKDEDGYYIGTHTVEGTNSYEGDKAEIYFKNENHVIWINGTSQVTSPDLIANINPDNIKPLRNEEIEVGTQILTIALPCDPILRKENVIKRLEPKYFGFDIEYKAFS